MLIFLSIDYLLLSFTHSLGSVSIVAACLSLMDLWSKSIHQAEGDFVSKWSEESFVRVGLDTQVALHLEKALESFHAWFVKFVADRLDLRDLDLESWILSLLTHVSFLDHIVENVKFFHQIALDVHALSFRYFFDGVLFLFQDHDFLLIVCNLLGELDDLILQLVNWCFETEGLLTAHRVVCSQHLLSSGHAQSRGWILIFEGTWTYN